nr:MAG TPA: hypothetical protein [Bacteriophage sp.]
MERKLNRNGMKIMIKMCILWSLEVRFLLAWHM